MDSPAVKMAGSVWLHLALLRLAVADGGSGGSQRTFHLHSARAPRAEPTRSPGAAAGKPTQSRPVLPQASPRTFTVSGHSSGGSMASQHFVAFSDRVVGLG